MTAAGWDVEAWSAPVTPERPCGENLEDQAPLVTLDALRLFGQPRPIDTDDTRKPTDWAEVRTLSIEGLVRTRDLRVLAYLGAAALRTDGLPAFFDTLVIAARWLEAYWVEVYPQLDEDAIARRNALNCLADPMAVLDRLRRLPIVESRQHGRFSLRDIDIAKGNLQPGANDARPELAQVDAAFGEMATDTLTVLHQVTAAALDAIKRIDARMRDEGDPVTFEGLQQQLARLQLVVQAQLAQRAPADEATADAAASGAAGAPGAGAVSAPGTIGSRQDAIRALDAVAEYFRQHEPSSPLPMLIDRAKRLVSKNFLEVLEEIAPEGLAGARAAGGLRDSAE
ncbi:MAG TPA: type VI secretion system protein TssA [Luteitalea sp.]|nr:type VI secretion system protein TssA [Luteitalea sp.]